MRRFLKWTSGLLVGLGLILCVGGWVYLNNCLPDLDGTITSDRIKGRTKITRDQWGVAHISAESKEDAYFAYGYTIAQDRLFQMELQRRLAQGELAEIMGESLLAVDKMFRTLMFKHWAEDYLRNQQAIHPEALQILDSFIEGINFHISTGNLPVEYQLLGFSPRPFTRLDCVSMVGYMAYSFADGIKRDALFTMLEEVLTVSDLDTIFPDYRLENKTTIMEPTGVAVQETSFHARDGKLQQHSSAPETNSDNKNRELLESILVTLKDAASIDPPFEGSNSWVLAPFRSKSGNALLANDPHIGIANPGVWYEAHIKYPGYENYGYHLPLIPLPMIAHNSVKGWAITMFLNDDLDLYAETFHPQNPDLVMHKGQWAEVRTLEEKVKVKDQAEVSLVVRITPHGPIISDFIKEYSGVPVAVNWVALLVENPVLNVMYEMAVAQNLTEFESALSQLAAPGLNVSYVDNKGNIAWWAAGLVPIRPEHVSGKKIHDGSSGKDDWLGYVPFAQNPKLINPENGVIITTNQLSTLNAVGQIPLLTGYFRPSDRGNRIYDLLAQQEKWSIEELKAIQTDDKLWAGVGMKNDIMKILSKFKSMLTPLEQKALSALNSWDGGMGLESTGGSVFQFTTYHILKNTLEPHMGEKHLVTYLNLVDHWDFLKRILNGKASPIEGKSATDTQKQFDQLILSGFRDAVQEMGDRLGKDESDWQWGKVHSVEWVHPVGRKKPLNLLFNIGPFPSPAEFTSVNKLKSSIGNHDYKVTSMPSTRRLIDIGSPENSWSILPTGNSGNFPSAFYDDQAEMFIHGEYRRIVFSELQIEQSKTHEIVLTPR
ncbi:penicillin acylase family protein [bacterium]|nr:penicillin acylase family protein [bacterium]